MTNEPTVTTEQRGHLYLIGLNRPDKFNAFNLDMLNALAKAYTELDRNDELRCGILFAHGKHFTSGLELDEVGPAFSTGEPLFPAGAIDPVAIQGPSCRKPVICAVHGWVITIGMELLLASDIRIAATSARFTQLEVKRGIMPFGGATLRLPRIAGWGNGMRYLLTGDTFDAEEAYRIGLVQELVETDHLVEKAVEIGSAIAKAAPLAVQASLASARMVCRGGGEPEALKSLITQARALMETDDAGEGIRSFIERREAEFKGK